MFFFDKAKTLIKVQHKVNKTQWKRHWLFFEVVNKEATLPISPLLVFLSSVSFINHFKGNINSVSSLKLCFIAQFILGGPPFSITLLEFIFSVSCDYKQYLIFCSELMYHLLVFIIIIFVTIDISIIEQDKLKQETSN